MSKKTVYLLLPMRCVVFLAVFLAAAAIVGKNVGEISSIWSVTATVVNLFTLMLLAAVSKKNGMTYRSLINYRKGQSSAKRVILTAVLSVVIGMGGMYLAGFVCYGTFMPEVSLKMIAPIPKVLAAVNIILLPVTTALAEDGLYLGCGVGQTENKYAALILPALFYGLQHCFIPVIPDVRYMAYRLLSFLPPVIFFCLHYRKNREPLPLMTGHALLDMATAASIFVTSAIPGAYEQWQGMV